VGRVWGGGEKKGPGVREHSRAYRRILEGLK
jgi:hypothetical protein